MADMITPNFSAQEMSCKCGCGKHGMDEEFMRMLQELRNEVGALRISSGFRCEDHNDKVSKIKNGPHTQAKASDILISGETGHDALRKSPSDRLQWDRGQPEGSAPQAVHACGHSGPEGVVVLLIFDDGLSAEHVTSVLS